MGLEKPAIVKLDRTLLAKRDLILMKGDEINTTENLK
jgi:hypothetical protein